MPVTMSEARQFAGGTLFDQRDATVGAIEDVYLDADTREPEWALVQVDSDRLSFVPLAEAAASGDRLTVPYGREQIESAPAARADDELSQQEEARLYRHYGLPYSEAKSGSGLPETDSQVDAGAAGAGYPDVAEGSMTVSEERLRVGVERVAGRKIRLSKHIVTEHVTETVPVTSERATLRREPVTDANRSAAMSGGDLTTEEHEVVLTGERVVVDRDVVPVERVRLAKDAVTENVDVTEEVRREQVVLEQDAAAVRPRNDR